MTAAPGRTIDIADGLTRGLVDNGTGELTATGPAFTEYNPVIIGVDYGKDGLPGNDDNFLTSGTGPVNQIVVLTFGNGYEVQDTDPPNPCTAPGSGTPTGCDTPANRQDRLNGVIASQVQQRVPFTVTATVTMDAVTASASANINTPQLSIAERDPGHRGRHGFVRRDAVAAERRARDREGRHRRRYRDRRRHRLHQRLDHADVRPEGLSPKR